MNIVDTSVFALDVYQDRLIGEIGPFESRVIAQRVIGSFAAVAYYLPDTNEIIVAYRGTDNPFFDGIAGWPIGSGQYDWVQTQVDLAFAFYSDVVNLTSDPSHEANSATLSFTGHSLGGGLAGLVASINELPAQVYNAMPFAEAATKLYEDVSGPNAGDYSYWSALAFPDGNVHPPSFAQIESAAIQDEILADLRWGTPFPLLEGGHVVTSGLDAQMIEQIEIQAGSVSSSVDLHGQALMTIALYGGLSHSQERQAGGNEIYKLLFDAAFASRLGFSETEALRVNLAYTIDDDVVALDSLFSDMDVLGEMSLTPNAFIDALAKLSVSHAVHIAATGASTLRSGLIEQGNGIANIALDGILNPVALIGDFVEFSAAALNGVFFDVPTDGLSNLAVSWSGYGGSAHLEAGATLYFGSTYEDDIFGSEGDDIIVSMGADATYHDIIRGGGGNDIIYASAGADTLMGGEGNDRMYGGAGNDVFHGGLGSDAMFGEAGVDTFHVGDGEDGDVDYISGGSVGTDTVNVAVGGKYRLDAAGAAAIRDQVVVDGFAAPIGHGIGIDTAIGDAFIQGVEIIKASAEANEVSIGTVADLAAAGGSTLDFTAGSMDRVVYTGEAPAYLTLSGDNGRSKAVQTGAAAVTFLGVDEWNLTSPGNSVTVDKSHLGLQAVTINGGLGIDVLNLSNFTTGIVFGLTPAIGGTNITATGFERVYGGSGDDTFYGTDADEVFLGNGGTNTFHGSLGADSMSSSGGNLIADYSLSAEAIIFVRPSSSSTSTSVVAHASTSVASMGYGDSLSATGWSDITGSERADSLLVVGTHGTLRSNGGADVLIGNKNGDTLIGADGYGETMRPGDGNDIIQFGTGGGTLDFGTSTRAAVIDQLAGTFIFGDQSDMVTGEFDKVIGTAYGDDIRGTEGADTIDGGGGSGYDVIYGRGGADTITFWSGVVHGGDGDDVVSSSQSSTIVFGEDGNDTISVGKNSLAYGGEGNDTITAGEGSTIWGDDGEDTINVSAKLVMVHGGAGADTINIAAVNWYAMSTLNYSQSDAGVSIVRAGNGFLASGGHAEGDQLSGMFSVVGSDFADVFDLDVSRLGYIKAGAGNDVITLRSTDGEAHGEGDDDTITLTSRYQKAFGGDGDDVFHGYGIMNGGNGDDEFYLNYGTYSTVRIGGTVNGGAGNNTIHLGGGRDIVHADEGANTVVVSDFTSDDTIHNFGEDDTFVFSGIGFLQGASDLEAIATQVGNNVVLDFGRTVDHPEVYGPGTSDLDLGSITIANATLQNFLSTGDFLFA